MSPGDCFGHHSWEGAPGIRWVEARALLTPSRAQDALSTKKHQLGCPRCSKTAAGAARGWTESSGPSTDAQCRPRKEKPRDTPDSRSPFCGPLTVPVSPNLFRQPVGPHNAAASDTSSRGSPSLSPPNRRVSSDSAEVTVGTLTPFFFSSKDMFLLRLSLRRPQHTRKRAVRWPVSISSVQLALYENTMPSKR